MDDVGADVVHDHLVVVFVNYSYYFLPVVFWIDIFALTGCLVRTCNVLEHVWSLGVVIRADISPRTALIFITAVASLEVADGAESFEFIDAQLLAVVRHRVRLEVGFKQQTVAIRVH